MTTHADLSTAATQAAAALKALAIAALLAALVLIRAFAITAKEMFDLLGLSACWLVRGLAVAADLAAIAIAYPIVWAAYGADVPAMIPAAVVCLMPIIAAVPLMSWNAFYAAAVATLIFTGIVAIESAITRTMLVTAAIAVYVFHQIFTDQKDKGHQP